MTSPSEILLYRVVGTDPATLADMTSPAVLGKPFTHPDPAYRRLWTGISCYATEAQARRNARRYRSHGEYVATIRIEPGAPIRIERTLGPGHYTIWGFPHELLARLIAIVLA
jgi:hypothetical protein